MATALMVFMLFYGAYLHTTQVSLFML